MFSQFQSRYPTGSLISELLQIHEGNFIVRVVVQAAGMPLATAMAAATSIEQAEDQARLRALGLLGIHPPAYESQAQLMADEDEPSVQRQPRLKPGIARLEPQVQPRPDLDSFPETSEWSIPQGLDIDPQQPDLFTQRDQRPASGSRNGHPQTDQARGSTPPAPGTTQPAPPAPLPLDLSDIIAQTSIELKRLGWNESRGRTYLQRTYGKRSRQQLTDEELLDFLHYLQDEPSPGEFSF
jgi:hypothetical protein